MKKIRLMLLIISMVFILTGCVRMSMDINVKKDGKVDAKLLYAVAEEFADEAGLDSYEEMIGESDGWKFLPYSKDGYVGVTCTISDVNLDDFLYSEENEEGLFNTIIIKKSGSKYILDVDVFDEDADGMDVSTAKPYIDLYGGYMKIVLHLPEPAINSNATSVSSDGKTLTWNLLSMNEGENVHAEFKLKTFKGGRLLGIVILLLIVLGGLILLKKRGKENNDGIQSSYAQERTAEINPNHETNTEGDNRVTEKPRVEKTVFCTQCGTKLGENDAFCPQCGKRI